MSSGGLPLPEASSILSSDDLTLAKLPLPDRSGDPAVQGQPPDNSTAQHDNGGHGQAMPRGWGLGGTPSPVQKIDPVHHHIK